MSKEVVDVLDRLKELRTRMRLLSVLLSSADASLFDSDCFYALSSLLFDIEKEIEKSLQLIDRGCRRS